MIVHRHYYFEGRVQGVGFRYTVKQLAAGFEVTGWVRNLADGRVELSIRGDEQHVAGLLEAIAASHLRDHIKRRGEADPPAGSGTNLGFEIRH